MDSTSLNKVTGEAPEDEQAGQDTESPLHDQWLLDEALAETFPASDPISPSAIKPRLVPSDESS